MILGLRRAASQIVTEAFGSSCRHRARQDEAPPASLGGTCERGTAQGLSARSFPLAENAVTPAVADRRPPSS